VEFSYACLLLLAGASSLHPGVLQELSYAARKEALLLFQSSVTAPSILYRIHPLLRGQPGAHGDDR
jgi:hypothetical protein